MMVFGEPYEASNGSVIITVSRGAISSTAAAASTKASDYHSGFREAETTQASRQRGIDGAQA